VAVELPRGVARAYRAVLRKCVQQGLRGPDCTVSCRAGPEGLELSCRQQGVLLRHATPGKRPAGLVRFPMSLLAQFEGRDGGAVKLEAAGLGKARASWKEKSGERALEFACPDVAEAEVPGCEMSSPGAGFMQALAEAAKTTAGEHARPALRGVLLKGGEMVATDGRQLLVQGGFEFPWEGEALVPALPAFALKELALEKPLLGRSGTTVVLSCGPWLVAMEEQESRHFPDVSRVVAGEWDSRLALHPADVALLRERLPSLPGHDDRFAPVLLELGRKPRVKAGAEEIALQKSRCSGPAVSVPVDRRLLLRALALGFTEVEAAKDRPLRCKDEKRTYLWMPLDGPAATPGKQTRREGHMPPDERGPTSNGTDQPNDAMEEAEAIRRQLQEALARTSRLIASLRQQKKQERAVKSAVASLRKLRELD
jgi:hypothetical protein